MRGQQGNRIREHLNPEDVVREAHTAIRDQLDCDVVLLLLPTEGQAGDHKSQWGRRARATVIMLSELQVAWLAACLARLILR
jgi:hypothetical protein